jgi:cysteine synthase A
MTCISLRVALSGRASRPATNRASLARQGLTWVSAGSPPPHQHDPAVRAPARNAAYFGIAPPREHVEVFPVNSVAPIIHPQRHAGRRWVHEALECLSQEAARSADTHLLKLNFPGFHGIDFYFKDEASHPSGSLKHRLARSLYLYALCNGRLGPGQTVVDASSGSTAISEAWFARLLGLRFIAVMPACTAPGKIRDVQALGGEVDLVDDPAQVHARAAWHAGRGACHLDQFGLAERATDWRGHNNIAESTINQLARERFPEPHWIVCGAGTGGTPATIGRLRR